MAILVRVVAAGPKKKKGALVAGAALLAAVVALDPPAGGSDLAARVRAAVPAAQQGHYDEAWQRMQLQVQRPAVRQEGPCAPAAHGEVRALLQRAPCRSLTRALLVARTGADAVVISVAWVRMRDTAGAGRLRQLLDRPGTGDIWPLPGRLVGLGPVRLTAAHYASRQSGPTVVVAESEPAAGRPPAALLDAVTQVAVQFPRM